MPCCDYKRLMKNLGVRITYTIIFAGLFIIGGFAIMDKMSAECAFSLEKVEDGGQLTGTISKEQVEDFRGIYYQITWGKKAVKTFTLNGSNITCAYYDPKDKYNTSSGTNISEDSQVSYALFQNSHLDNTFLADRNVTCYPFFDAEQQATMEDLSYSCFVMKWTLFAISLFVTLNLILVWICCAGWCRCEMFGLCRSICSCGH